jgi:hypothetical protein
VKETMVIGLYDNALSTIMLHQEDETVIIIEWRGFERPIGQF